MTEVRGDETTNRQILIDTVHYYTFIQKTIIQNNLGGDQLKQ